MSIKSSTSKGCDVRDKCNAKVVTMNTALAMSRVGNLGTGQEWYWYILRMIVVVTADSQGDFLTLCWLCSTILLCIPRPKTLCNDDCTHVVLGGGGCVDVVVVVIVVVVAAGGAVDSLVLPVAATTSADFKIARKLFGGTFTKTIMN